VKEKEKLIENNIKVSVVVPVYNVEKYLAKCIESILEQTYTNWELILVNDGSSDNSGKIADEYAGRDSRIKVIHQKNSGVSTARNAGIEIAEGDYVCFADSDDYLMPEYIDYLLKLALKYDADISLTTEMFTNYYENQIADDKFELYSPEKAFIEILCYNLPIGVYCKLFKRSFLGNTIRFKKEIFIGEGLNFNTYAFQRANKIAVGHKRIYYYRRDNTESATTKFSEKKWINGLKAIDVVRKDQIIHTKAADAAVKYVDWHTHCDALNLMLIADAKKENMELYKRCIKMARKGAITSLFVPIRFRERIRALIMLICPELMSTLMVMRRKRYGLW